MFYIQLDYIQPMVLSGKGKCRENILLKTMKWPQQDGVMMKHTMSEMNASTKITAYVADPRVKLAQETKLQEDLDREAKEKSESDAWAQIMAYLTKKQEKTALEAKLHLELDTEANIVR